MVDGQHFDGLTRTVGPCRRAIGALASGIAVGLGLLGIEETGAHNPLPSCRGIADPGKRRTCLRRATRHKRLKHTCKAQPATVTCANRCGSVPNNCGKAVSCTCPAGKRCRGNGGCNRTCLSNGTLQGSCPAGCNCLTRNADDGSAQCVVGTVTGYEHVPLGCVSSANCPAGHFCGTTACGPGNTQEGRCVPVGPL